MQSKARVKKQGEGVGSYVEPLLREERSYALIYSASSQMGLPTAT